jgi:hypothetical protein
MASLLAGLVAVAFSCIALSQWLPPGLAVGLLLILGAAAVITGIIAMRRLRSVRPRPSAWKLALIGLVLGVVSVSSSCLLAAAALGEV